MSDTKRQNARARASGLFVVMPKIAKNKSAERYYRDALDKIDRPDDNGDCGRLKTRIYDGRRMAWRTSVIVW